MKELYSEANVAAAYKKYKLHLACAILTGMVTIGGFILFLVFITDETKVLFNWLAAGILILGGWGVLSWVFFSLRPLKRYILQEETVLGGVKITGKGRLVKIGEPLTIGRGRLVIPLTFMDGSATREVYFDDEKGKVPFAVNEEIVYAASENYLFAYEARHD